MVIDAKVVALLMESAEASDHHDVLEGASGMYTRIVATRELQNDIKMFLNLFRSCIASRRVVPVPGTNNRVVKRDRWVVRNGKMDVRLVAMVHFGSTKGQVDRNKLVEYMKAFRW